MPSHLEGEPHAQQSSDKEYHEKLLPSIAGRTYSREGGPVAALAKLTEPLAIARYLLPFASIRKGSNLEIKESCKCRTPRPALNILQLYGFDLHESLEASLKLVCLSIAGGIG